MKEIVLKGGERTNVDECDFCWLNKYNWWYVDGYAVTEINGKSVSMHRIVAGASNRSVHVHHKNKNRLDNRRSNLVKKDASEHKRGHATEFVAGARNDYHKWLAERKIKASARALKLYREETGDHRWTGWLTKM